MHRRFLKNYSLWEVSLVCILFIISPFALSNTLKLVTIEHPPHSYASDGGVIGGVTELLEIIFSDMGYSVDISIMPAKRAEAAIKKGEADILYPVTYSDERNDYMFYSEPIAQINTIFFKRASSKITWNRLEDLSDYVVGLNGGFNYPSDFQSASKKKIFRTEPLFSPNSTLDNLRKLSLKRIDLFICNKAVCNFYIRQYAPEFNNLDYIPKAVGPDNTFHVGFSKSLENGNQLRERFSHHLQKMIRNGRLDKIYRETGVKF